MKNLAEYREEIDQIDEQIVRLIAQRKRCVEGVAEVKAREGMQALQSARFESVLEHCRQIAAENGVDPEVVEAVWNILHDYFVALEQSRLTKH